MKTDQPGHLPILIRVFSVHIKKSMVLSRSLSTAKTDYAGLMPRLILGFAGCIVFLAYLSFGS